MKCKWNDCGYCYSDSKLPKNADAIDAACLGYAQCQAYKQWVLDQDMIDTTTLAEAREHIMMGFRTRAEVAAEYGLAPPVKPTLGTTKPTMGAVERKQRPVYSGVLKYFPLALMEVAHCSWLGQQQHNPDLPLAWDRSKSADELDAMVRHMMDIDELDSDGVLHAAKVAWRSLAYLEKLLETNNEEQA